MQNYSEFKFSFYEEEFNAYVIDLKVYVPVRRICEALEIDPSSQYRRLKDDEVTAEKLLQLEIETEGGKQETNCLEARRLPYWLGGIDASRIKDEDKRKKIVAFKKDMADVLWATYRSYILPDDLLAETDSRLPQAEQEYLQLMADAEQLRQAIKDGEDHRKAIEEQVGDLQNRMGRLEATLVLDNYINEAQQARFRRMVGALGTVLNAKGQKSAYRDVYRAVYKNFQVPKYSMLTTRQWPDVIKFLANWYRNSSLDQKLPGVFTEEDQTSMF
jgi:P22_AR N-terminal domain/ORF6C domain